MSTTTKEAKIQREIAHWEREREKPKNHSYLIYFMLIIAVVYVADELASQIGSQMQSVIASELFAPLVGADVAVARMALINTIAGCSIGIGFLYRPLADRFGRKPFLVINTLGMGLGMLLISVATNIPVYAIGAFVIQFFVPHDMQQVYIHECVPAEKRARIYSIIKAVVTLSLLLIPVLRGAFLHGNDLSQWRIVYLIPAILAIVIAIFAMFFIRESDAFVETRLHQLKMTDEEKAAEKAEHKKQDTVSRGGIIHGLKFCFTHKQIRWMFIAGGLISFGQLATQYYETIMTFGYAQQFVDSGMAMDAARVAATPFVTQALMLFSVGSAIFQLFPGFIADKFGRKVACIIMCASTTITFLLFYIGSNLDWNPYLVGLFCGGCVGSYWAAGDMVGLVCSESTPTNLRASVLAMQPMFQGMIFMLASTGVTIVGNVMGDAAIGTTVLMVAVPGMVLGLILMMLKVKETKGVDMRAIRGDEFEK